MQYHDKLKVRRSLSKRLIASKSIIGILDFLPARQIIRLQVLSKLMYFNIVPNYCTHSEARSKILQQFRLPERVQRKSLFVYKGQ